MLSLISSINSFLTKKLFLIPGNILKERYSLFVKCILVFLILPLFTFSQSLIPPIGQWRDHLNYQHTLQVLRGDKLYCATTTNLFSISFDNEIEQYSKVTGLNDLGVQCIGWDASTQQLVVAYASSNIDVLKGNAIKNISDIKRTSVPGNKTINAVYCKDGFAYLSTGLGIIVVNLSKFEIKDTWLIGNNGTQIKINGLTSDGVSFYAATEEGLKNVAQNSSNISNYANWQTLSGNNGLTKGPVKNSLFTNNKIIVEKNDTLFILNGNTWSFLYSDKDWLITNSTATENKIAVCQQTSNGNARVIVLNTGGVIEKTISQNNILSNPRSALLENNTVWVADLVGGLTKFGTTTERYIPNGPPGVSEADMLIQNNILFTAAGSVSSEWKKQNNKNGVYSFLQEQWNYKGFYNTPILDSVLDFISLAIDPSDASVWAGSYGGGLVNFIEGSQPRIYKKTNSSLQPAIGDPTSYRVSGLAFDQNKNLWISNYGAVQNLQVRKSDSTWKSFAIPFTHQENSVGQLLVDDNNQIWILSPKGNGIFCFSYGQGIDNLQDDKWKYFRQGSGNGNLPSNNILCLLKDKNGFIWVGTDKGIGIIQCTSDIFSAQSCEAILPIVQQDQFAGLLFRNEMVQCMAVDGANRKWIGTKNGVWLISSDGDKIIYRFTEENSPLLNNDIKRIAIDATTGEVFISTSQGICSFRSTATEGGTTNNAVLVFPNPVPPGYNGTIAIKGLVENALVKITELNGRLIYQTRALGGQAIWNGYNYKGEKTASGIYLVIVRDDNGLETIATKIVLISGR